MYKHVGSGAVTESRWLTNSELGTGSKQGNVTVFCLTRALLFE